MKEVPPPAPVVSKKSSIIDHTLVVPLKGAVGSCMLYFDLKLLCNNCMWICDWKNDKTNELFSSTWQTDPPLPIHYHSITTPDRSSQVRPNPVSSDSPIKAAESRDVVGKSRISNAKHFRKTLSREGAPILKPYRRWGMRYLTCFDLCYSKIFCCLKALMYGSSQLYMSLSILDYHTLIVLWLIFTGITV